MSVRCCALTLPGAPFRQRTRPVAPFDEGAGSIRIVAACTAGLAARGAGRLSVLVPVGGVDLGGGPVVTGFQEDVAGDGPHPDLSVAVLLRRLVPAGPYRS